MTLANIITGIRHQVNGNAYLPLDLTDIQGEWVDGPGIKNRFIRGNILN